MLSPPSIRTSNERIHNAEKADRAQRCLVTPPLQCSLVRMAASTGGARTTAARCAGSTVFSVFLGSSFVSVPASVGLSLLLRCPLHSVHYGALPCPDPLAADRCVALALSEIVSESLSRSSRVAQPGGHRNHGWRCMCFSTECRHHRNHGWRLWRNTIHASCAPHSSASRRPT